MYYPYFRGKQFDLAALNDLLIHNRLSIQIAPIIEPVKQSKTLTKTIELFKAKEQPFYLIQNPQAGDFHTINGPETLAAYNAPNALIINHPLNIKQHKPDLFIVDSANASLESDWSDNRTQVLIREEFRLLNKVVGPLILSQDVFTRLPKNSFYHECSDELFSTAHLTYQQKGFIGFSDFSIDSRIYYEHSYPSKQLSLHLVYLKNEQLRIHHFISSEDLSSQKDKFFELIAELELWLATLCGEQLTAGIQLLLAAAAQEKFPGMGIMRKASVMHHLEIISRYLDNIR
ncbi:sce7725 family protein [Enterococcus sp. LJL99]